MTLIIIGIIATLLYLLAYTGRRRFGILGLGLAAGTVLARAIGGDLSLYLAVGNIPVTPLSYGTASAVLLTILPALILLAGGPTYAKKRQARLGAALFALLGTLLVLGPLTAHLNTSDEIIRQILDATAKWQGYIVAGGIGLAIIDVLLYKPPKPDITAKH
jgi:hypothetical protein